MKLLIRFALPEDSRSLAAVYRSNITKISAMHNRTPVPTAVQLEQMIQEISPEYPFLVCQLEKRLLGCCYAHSGVEAASVDRDVEFFVTVDREVGGCGVGTALCQALFELLRRQNVQRIFGRIQTPNPRAEQLLMKYRFELSGHFYSKACMCGQQHDVLWFDKWIHIYSKQPPAVCPVRKLRMEECKIVFQRACSEIDEEELKFCL